MEAGVRKQISARKLTILLLLAAPDSNKKIQSISGTTRMQKLVFLVSKKSHLALKDSTHFSFDFNYEPEKFGPADIDLYQDLEFLRTMRLITWDNGITLELSQEPCLDTVMITNPTKIPALLPEEKEEDELSFEYLMGVDPLELLVADTETEGERQYMITEKGLALLEKLRTSSVGRQKEQFDALEKACNEIRQEYGDWSLKRLLKYVYNNYSDLTTKSTILERIKGTR